MATAQCSIDRGKPVSEKASKAKHKSPHLSENSTDSTGVVYVRPRVVVAPTAAPNKVVLLVPLNLALSSAQTHSSAPFCRCPPRYRKRNVQNVTLEGRYSVAARIRVAVTKNPLCA